MISKLKFSVLTASVGNLGCRCLTSGYKQPIGIEEKLKQIAQVEGLDGVELCYNPQGDESDALALKQLLEENQLAVPVVNAPLAAEKRWQLGTFSAKDEQIRQKAIEVTQQTVDFAEGVGAGIVNLWLGQDGIDYCFQDDYTRQWEAMIESVRVCADYNPNVRLALEFKPREPRNRSLLNTVSTTLLIINEIDRANVGLTIDNGHVLQHGENMAHAVELAARYGKLYNLHLNDNYAAWDDDMIVGSVHLVEYLELCYSLRKVGYNGWCSIDIFPFREDAFRATEESIRYLDIYNNWIDKIGFEQLKKLVEQGDVPEVLKSIRATLFA